MWEKTPLNIDFENAMLFGRGFLGLVEKGMVGWGWEVSVLVYAKSGQSLKHGCLPSVVVSCNTLSHYKHFHLMLK